MYAEPQLRIQEYRQARDKHITEKKYSLGTLIDRMLKGLAVKAAVRQRSSRFATP